MNLKGWKVKIVGDGPYKEKLLKLREEYGLMDKVEFLGWVDNSSKQMKELYGHASIFVLPSHFENMSIVLLEALASGCKVIATNVGGNPEVVGEKGILIKEKNSPEIQKNLLKFIMDMRGTKTSDFSRFKWRIIIKNYYNLF